MSAMGIGLPGPPSSASAGTATTNVAGAGANGKAPTRARVGTPVFNVALSSRSPFGSASAGTSAAPGVSASASAMRRTPGTRHVDYSSESETSGGASRDSSPPPDGEVQARAEWEQRQLLKAKAKSSSSRTARDKSGSPVLAHPQLAQGSGSPLSRPWRMRGIPPRDRDHTEATPVDLLPRAPTAGPRPLPPDQVFAAADPSVLDGSFGAVTLVGDGGHVFGTPARPWSTVSNPYMPPPLDPFPEAAPPQAFRSLPLPLAAGASATIPQGQPTLANPMLTSPRLDTPSPPPLPEKDPGKGDRAISPEMSPHQRPAVVQGVSAPPGPALPPGPDSRDRPNINSWADLSARPGSAGLTTQQLQKQQAKEQRRSVAAMGRAAPYGGLGLGSMRGALAENGPYPAFGPAGNAAPAKLTPAALQYAIALQARNTPVAPYEMSSGALFPAPPYLTAQVTGLPSEPPPPPDATVPGPKGEPVYLGLLPQRTMVAPFEIQASKKQDALSLYAALGHPAPPRMAEEGPDDDPDKPKSGRDEACLECLMRDQDMIDVIVSGPHVWDRPSDAEWWAVCSAEEKVDALGPTGPASSGGDSQSHAPSASHSNASLGTLARSITDSGPSEDDGPHSAPSLAHVRALRSRLKVKQIRRGERLTLEALKRHTQMVRNLLELPFCRIE